MVPPTFGSAVLKRLRDLLQKRSVEALLVPSSDAHNSEYVSARFKYRGIITNFHGSAGTALVTADAAFLWTDGRYWLEAEASLFPGWQLMKDGLPDVPTMDDWIENHIGRKARVGVNASLVTIAQWEKWEKKFSPIDIGSSEIEAQVDELDQGGEARAASASSSEGGLVFPRPPQFDGLTCVEKIHLIAQQTLEKFPETDLLVVSALDEVAWLTNLRGSDIPYNPVFYAYALLSLKPTPRLILFAAKEKFSSEALAALESSNVDVVPYESLLRAQPPLRALERRVVLVDENQVSWGLKQALEKVHCVRRTPLSPVMLQKARKHPVEISGFKQSHIRDGVALTRYLAWLTHIIQERGGIDETGARVTEYSGAAKLELLRREEDHFVQLSFGTISGSGPNGAIIHYAPSPTNSAPIAADALYLVDSGAQYYDGTTDVTRTVCFNTEAAGAEEREAYTLVLKGHIAIQRCVWPKGTTGHRLDAFARQALWSHGLNYAHGTGHGVGSFLNVHEGPQGIHTRPTATGAPIEESMILSNEPGFYKANHFGIRIENLEVVVGATTKYNNGDYLTFETLTLAPLCRDLIDVALLTAEEVQWVNAYHARVLSTLGPRIEGRCGSVDDREVTMTYLRYHCAAL